MHVPLRNRSQTVKLTFTLYSFLAKGFQRLIEIHTHVIDSELSSLLNNKQTVREKLCNVTVSNKVVGNQYCFVAMRFAKAKFHYTIWSQTGAKLVADLQRAGIWRII